MRWSALSLGLFGFLVSLGCQGRIAPLSAQAGSTVLIPLDGGPYQVLGYGGEIVEDHQRGTLVYQLDGPGGFELQTRASAQVLPPPNSPIVHQAAFPKRQIISLVDIPPTAPLGTHSLHVVRRRMEGGSPVDYPGPNYAGQIKILPNQITFNVNGSPQTVTGAETPLEKYFCLFGSCGWSDATPQILEALPLPELHITLSSQVSALELDVDYPDAVIEIQDLYEPPGQHANHLARVWSTSAGPGSLQIGAVAGISPFSTITLSFSLVDGAAAILDPADVTVGIVGAWDANGAPVSVTVVSKTIR